MLGIRNRIINVPVPLERIKANVEVLPRTFEEAEVIPVAVKKRKSMVSSMFEQNVRPHIFRKAVQYLIEMNYPFYDNVEFDLGKLDNMLDNLLDDCEEELDNVDMPQEVFDTIDEENDVVPTPLRTSKNEKNKEDENTELVPPEEVEDVEYIEKDPVRKHQTEVSNVSYIQ